MEDETIVSFLIEDMLRELGAVKVWHAPSVARALALVGEECPDAALLDVNLGHEYAYPVAADLTAKSIPFIFATGYGRNGIAPEWAGCRVLQKPFDTRMLGDALYGAIENR